MNSRKWLFFFVVMVSFFFQFWTNSELKNKVPQTKVSEFKNQQRVISTDRKPPSISKTEKIVGNNTVEKTAINFDDQLVDGIPVFLIGPEQVQKLTDEEFQELHGDWELSSPTDSLEISFGKDDPRSISYSLRKKDEVGMSGGIGGEIGKSDKVLLLRLIDGKTYYVITSRSPTQMELEMYKKTSSNEHFEHIRNFTLTRK